MCTLRESIARTSTSNYPPTHTHTHTPHTQLTQLYPRYTYGPSGEYSTKDGQVTATDIKVVCGKGSKVSSAPGHVIPPPSALGHVISAPGHVIPPPSGMMVFNDTDYASQDNSQSCDPRQVSHDDVLVEGSLLDIETHTSHAPTRQGCVVKTAPGPTNTSKLIQCLTEWLL